MNAMNALPMSKTEALKTYAQDDDKPYDKLVIGAIITNQNPETELKILLLKRAAHEMYYPNVFEIPGGNVEESDHTIADAVKREVFGETAIRVSKVVGAVTPFAYSMEKKITQSDGEESSIWKTSLQLNFICEVTKSDFVANPDEHSEGRFVGRSDIVEMDITEQMRAVVEEGFVWIGENLVG